MTMRRSHGILASFGLEFETGTLLILILRGV